MNQWSGVSEAYRRSFATLCAGTIGEVLDRLPPGHLLDVGCGTGDLLEAALQLGWDATGMDADSDMVAISRAATPARVLHAALPELPLPDAEFDAVAANFVINHVPDPRAALADIARVTRARGKIAVTIWPVGGGGWANLIGPVFSAADAGALPATQLPAHLDFERTTKGLAGIAKDTGLTVTEACELTWTWHITPADLWAGISGGVATAGQTYLAQAPHIRERIAAGFTARAADLANSGILAFENRAVLVVAQR
ncbi:class I SAM-dependent methyltransferase [Devriesea agamarum]|uniref:class I SAM-dependent methyltransferase n=1 Tax=Devriesea agamarum TaxID=472569 RepID=UPI00071D1E76|nr:class I SAM-dependent methyltransferase [Devriesea agamarum]